MSDILSVAEVDEMIQGGDIDFDKYKGLAAKSGFETATDEQIKTAIGMQQDDDDKEFVEHLCFVTSKR